MFGCDGYKNFLVSWGETLDLYWTSSDHNHGVWCLITEEIGGDIYLDVRWDHNQLYLSQLIGKTGEILFIPNHVNRTQSQFDSVIQNNHIKWILLKRLITIWLYNGVLVTLRLRCSIFIARASQSSLLMTPDLRPVKTPLIETTIL